MANVFYRVEIWEDAPRWESNGAVGRVFWKNCRTKDEARRALKARRNLGKVAEVTVFRFDGFGFVGNGRADGSDHWYAWDER